MFKCYHIISCINNDDKYIVCKCMIPESYLDEKGTLHAFYRHLELRVWQSFVKEKHKCCKKIAEGLYIIVEGAGPMNCFKYLKEAEFTIISKEEVLKKLSTSPHEVRYWSK